MMIARWRLWMYAIVIFVSTLFSILGTYNRVEREGRKLSRQRFPGESLLRAQTLSLAIHHDHNNNDKNNNEDGSRSLAASTHPGVVVERIKPVIAPWTKLMKKDGKIQPRSFVFSEPTKYSDYGLKVTDFDLNQRDKILNLMEDRICQRSKKYATSAYEASKCRRKTNLWKCASCSELDGAWYMASSVNGAVFGRVDGESKIRYPLYNDGPYMYQQLDLAVPISGQDNKLKTFALRLGPAVKKFREGMQGSRIAIRLLVTRFAHEEFASDQDMQAFQNELTKRAELLRPGDSVEFVSVKESTFSRAKAVNALHAVACHLDSCVFACTDVDLKISSPFLHNALIFPFAGAAAYFPIMWSEYNPETVNLADKFLTESAAWTYTDHHGYWRKSSYGMYVISGSDARNLLMDESFVGWGGEDNDFFERAGRSLNIIRAFEKGLIHVWHEKDCVLGSFVENNFFKSCIGAKAHTEGSQLGLYLRTLRHEDSDKLDAILKVKSSERVTEQAETAADDAELENVSVLIAVISSRANLNTRAAAIMKTWAEPSWMPASITLKFFVGAAENDDASFSGSTDDIESLAKDAGIRDLSMLYVMKDVQDDEYPPVRKNSAMIKHLEDIVVFYENDPLVPSTFQWIFKVDDDAYVNSNNLLEFLKARNSVGYHVYGERGYGRKEDLDGLAKGGLLKPYCTGGPGYILSRPTLKKTAIGMSDCVKAADLSPYRDYLWHSDVVIGMCVTKQTGAGCWSDEDYNRHRVFRNNFQKEDPFIADSALNRMISMHPFKDASSMEKQHQRFVALKPEAKRIVHTE